MLSVQHSFKFIVNVKSYTNFGMIKFVIQLNTQSNLLAVHEYYSIQRKYSPLATQQRLIYHEISPTRKNPSDGRLKKTNTDLLRLRCLMYSNPNSDYFWKDLDSEKKYVDRSLLRKLKALTAWIV